MQVYIMFALYLGATGDHSVAQLKSIRDDLEDNDLRREIFGDKTPTKQGSVTWTEEHIEYIIEGEDGRPQHPPIQQCLFYAQQL